MTYLISSSEEMLGKKISRVTTYGKMLALGFTDGTACILQLARASANVGDPVAVTELAEEDRKILLWHEEDK